MAIYTKAGDQGLTALFDGKRVLKDHPRLVVLGELDELSAVLGLARAQTEDTVLIYKIEDIQRDIFVLGSELAAQDKAKYQISPDHVDRLEKDIDAMEKALPPLTHFVLPGGGKAGAALHLARAVCRRAERSLATLSKTEKLPDDAQTYLNRLSDYLFVLARHINQADLRPETPWASHKP